MKVLIDGRAFESDNQRGIQRYYSEILSRGGPDCKLDMLVRTRISVELPQNVMVTELSEHFPKDPRDLLGRAVAKLRRKWMPTPLPAADVFHSTYFTPNPCPALPEVLTVYDMIPEVIPYYYGGAADAEIAKKKKSILAANRIIAISHATAADLEAVYPEVAGRIEVIHLGGQHFPRVTADEMATQAPDAAPYVLFVGQRGGHKNFSIMLNAVADANWPDELNVVVAGGPFSEAELTAIRYWGLEKRFRCVVHPADSALRALYLGASSFVFPSILEGFGFPMLEAQALGVPVVASDTRVFHEVGGQGFIPVAPLDASSIAKGVSKALESNIRSSLVASGLENVDRFSWDVCAERTFEVFKKAALEV